MAEVRSDLGRLVRTADDLEHGTGPDGMVHDFALSLRYYYKEPRMMLTEADGKAHIYAMWRKTRTSLQPLSYSARLSGH